MARQLTEADFNKYRDQGLKRWIEFQTFRLAHSAPYERALRRSKLMTMSTTVLAIATAVFAGLDQFIESLTDSDPPIWPTTILAVLTAIVGIVQKHHNFEKKAEKFRKCIAGGTDGTMRIRQWIEKLSDGYMSDDDETFISTTDGQYSTLAATSEILSFDTWREQALHGLEEEGLRKIEFRHAAAPDDALRDAAPQSEGPTEGMTRPARRRGGN